MQKADHEDIPGSRGRTTASQIYANETSQDPTRWGLSTGGLHPVLQLEGPSTSAGLADAHARHRALSLL